MQVSTSHNVGQLHSAQCYPLQSLSQLTVPVLTQQLSSNITQLTVPVPTQQLTSNITQLMVLTQQLSSNTTQLTIDCWQLQTSWCSRYSI